MTLTNGLALTPPMGWNSWDCYGMTVSEEQVKANANYMAAHLLSYGWNYIVVDIQWYEPNAELVMDVYGRLMPTVFLQPLMAQDLNPWLMRFML